ncbi:MAG: hypothetical protein WCC39_11525, partial [Telluria sp.]
MPTLRLPTSRSPRLAGAALLVIVLGVAAGMAHADDARPAEVKGQYDLADGRLLTITGSGHRLRAQLDGRDGIRLVPAGGAVFDAADGSFRLRFREHANGNVTAVTLDVMRVARVAAAQVADVADVADVAASHAAPAASTST